MSDYKGKMPVRSEGVYEVANNEEPASSGVVCSERSGSIGVATMSKRITAKNGDENKIAMDVSISDGNGNSINKDNPLPAYLTESPGDEIEDYSKQNALKNGGSVNHDYTVTSGFNFRDLNVECNSAGLAVFELQVEDGVGAGTFTTINRKHNSVSRPDVVFVHKKPKSVGPGIIIRVVKTNLDNQDTDLDSLINGVEIAV